MQNANLPLIEIAHCPDIFASGVARVEKVSGDCIRVVMYARSINECGQPVRLIVARIIRPIDTLINPATVLTMMEIGQSIGRGTH